MGCWGGGLRRLALGSRVLTVKIGGVVQATSGFESVWERMVIMDIAAAQEWFESVGRLDRIDVVTNPHADVRAVQRQLESQLPYGTIVRRPVQRGEQVEAMVAAFRINLLMLSAVGLLVGGFLVYNTLSFSVAQRRRDIGILRAIGLSTRGVAAVFLCEGLGYGVIGGATGSALGILLSHSLMGVVERNISDLYISMSEVPALWPTLSQVAPVVSAGMLGGVALSLLGAWNPSREASRTHIVAALAPGGYELARIPRLRRWWWSGIGLIGCAVVLACLPPRGAVPVFGYLSVLCLLLGLSALAPALIGWLETARQWSRSHRPDRDAAVSLAGLAAAAAGRAPHRNGVTMSSLLVGLAITVGVVVMIGSFRHTVEVWIDQTVVADFIVTPTGWLKTGEEPHGGRTLPRRWADRLADLAGVAGVDTYRSLNIELAGRPRTLVARDLGLHAEHSRYLFLEGDSWQVLRRTVDDRGVVISEILADATRLTVGQELILATPAGPRPFRVQGIFLDYATDGGKVVMDRSVFREYWGDDRATVIPVYAAQGTDLGRLERDIRTRLQEEVNGVDGFAVLPNAELRREILAIFDRTFGLTYVLEAMAVMIAMFGIVNTLLTAALERRRELATLQALGASQAQVTGLLVWEAAYVGALGGTLGALGGVGLAAVLVWVINKQSFGWTIPLAVPPGYWWWRFSVRWDWRVRRPTGPPGGLHGNRSWTVFGMSRDGKTTRGLPMKAIYGVFEILPEVPRAKPSAL